MPRDGQSERTDFDWLAENIECQYYCPVGTSARGYLNAVAEGNYELGYRLAREPNPIAAICGYVCSAPCEKACRRGDIDRPLAIRQIKRFLNDWKKNHGLPEVLPRPARSGYRVAVIGAGPAGIAAAWELAVVGHEVVIFDELNDVGGTCVSGIPRFRLPMEVIYQDVDRLKGVGVQITLGVRVGKDVQLDALLKDFDAVMVAAGAQRGARMNVPGENLQGVVHALEFLRRVNFGERFSLGKKIAVIGGGYTAMDASRSAARILAKRQVPEQSSRDYAILDATRMARQLGAAEVTIAYRRSREEMVVDEEELHETMQENVRLEWLTSPVEVLTKDGIHVSALKCVRNQLGAPDARGRRSPEPIPGSDFVLDVDTIILAIGQAPDLSFMGDVEVTNRRLVKVDPLSYMTSRKGLFATGDYITGPRTLIEACADGKKAAWGADRWLRGIKDARYVERFHVYNTEGRGWPAEFDPNYIHIPRVETPYIPLHDRGELTTEVELTFSEEMAKRESIRCLRCNMNINIHGDLCILCGGCVDVCPEQCFHMMSADEAAETAMHEVKSAGEAQVLPLGDNLPPQEQPLVVFGFDELACIRCGLCVKRCPTGAITMDRFEGVAEWSDGRKVLDCLHHGMK